MTIDTTPPTLSYTDNEKVKVIYKGHLHDGIIKGESFENRHLIITYQVFIQGHGIVPRVHYLLKKIEP